MADLELVIVDDDLLAICYALPRALGHRERGIASAGDGVEPLSVPKQHPTGTFAAAIVDLRMPRVHDIELLTETRRRGLPTEVLHLTGDGTIRKPVLKRAETTG